ncbi:hypothetical protein pb186bvf_012029 [Paramecium bursaria]
MFPSKLYDLQLTPSLRKFNNDLESEKIMSKFKQLLKDDKKEIISSAQDLMKAMSIAMYGTQAYHQTIQELTIKQSDELLALSNLFQRKIVIYDINEKDLKCQIVNGGYKQRIYIARYMNYFYAVGSLGQSDNQLIVKDILQEIVNSVLGQPLRKHKRSFSDPFKYLSDQKDSRRIKNVPVSPSNISRVSWQDSKIQMREQYIDEINQEGDLLMQECSSIWDSPNDILQSLNLNIETVQSTKRHFGTLKFYDEQKAYGFIIMDSDGSDLFVHSDDLQKAGISKEFLRQSKQGFMIRLSFSILEYFGKYQKSRKAVEIQYIQENHNFFQ